MQLSGVPLVEELHEHEGVEDHGVVPGLGARRYGIRQDGPVEDHEAGDDDLVERVAEHVRPHLRGDDEVRAIHRRSVQLPLLWRLRGEGQGCQRVHDQVEPQHLQNRQGRLQLRERNNEVDAQDCDVHRQLELEELLDGVEDVSAPVRCSDDAGKVVVQQDDVGGVFRNLCAGDAHGEANVSGLKGRSVVGPVTGHGDHLPVREDGDLLLGLEALTPSLVAEEHAVVQAPGQRELVLW
mmetsp:Transcript_49772/g.133239  ORF Transcript_49772/g.133239 Transcript_49772/m.133239 type:complete len:238 (-) Transcript_49772:1652-2365(-)